MHGATPFVIESGKAAAKKASASAPIPTYTEVFGHALVAEAERDPRVVGITAAMLKGTGMQHMMARFPERTYDVGIAEQHAVGVRLRAGHRRLPPGVRDLLHVPAAGVRSDRPRRRHPGPAGRLRDRPRRPGGRRRPDPSRRLRHRLPAGDPRADRDGPDGRGRAGRHAPHGAAHGRPGGHPVPARRRPRRAAAASAPSRSRSAGRRCSSWARAWPWWATATAPSWRARPAELVAEATGVRPTVVNARFCQAHRRRADAPAGRAATTCW